MVRMILKLFKKSQIFLALLLFASVGFAGNNQIISPVVFSVVRPVVIPITGYGGEDTEDFTGLYWGTARTAYWTDTRVALWTTTRITEVP